MFAPLAGRFSPNLGQSTVAAMLAMVQNADTGEGFFLLVKGRLVGSGNLLSPKREASLIHSSLHTLGVLNQPQHSEGAEVASSEQLQAPRLPKCLFETTGLHRGHNELV